jgi:hypothetical protein
MLLLAWLRGVLSCVDDGTMLLEELCPRQSSIAVRCDSTFHNNEHIMRGWVEKINLQAIAIVVSLPHHDKISNLEHNILVKSRVFG